MIVSIIIYILIFGGIGAFLYFKVFKSIVTAWRNNRVSKLTKNNEDAKNPNKVRVFILRPREQGGASDAYIDKDQLPAGVVKRNIMGVKLPWITEIDGKYEPFIISDLVIVTPEKVGRIVGCEPYQKLKQARPDLWEQIKPMYPILALIIGIIGMVMIQGS